MQQLTKQALENFIDPTSFSVTVSLDITCFDNGQIVSRPVGDGYNVSDLLGAEVRISADDGNLGAIPAGDAADGDYDLVGYCNCAIHSLAGRTFAGVVVDLGNYSTQEQVDEAKTAIAGPVELLLSLIAPETSEPSKPTGVMTVLHETDGYIPAPYDPEVLGFSFEGTLITNPFLSECSRFAADPRKYGFVETDTGGGCKALTLKLPDGTMLMLTNDDGSYLPADDGSDCLIGKFDEAWNQLAYIEIVNIPSE